MIFNENIRTKKQLFMLILILLLSISSYSQKYVNTEKLSTNDDTIIGKLKYPHKFKYEGNPLARNHSATDPDAHVWNDTVWVYCSQDHEKLTNDLYASMDGYHVYSSADMKNWTDHGEIFHSRNVSWGIEGGGFMFAPCAVRKDGKFYLYFPHKNRAGEWKIGVAIGNRPQGPFKDIGNYIEGTSGIDPSVFIDDDGQAYMYFDKNRYAKMKNNLIELAEEPKKLIYGSNEVMSNGGTLCHEGPYMHKRNGIYYYSYTNLGKPYGAYYAMGTSPTGPFEWKGALAKWPIGAQDHHSMIEFKGEWYYFYHISVPKFPPVRKGHARIVSFDKLYYNKDGTIQMIEETTGPTKTIKINAPEGSVQLNPPGRSYTPGTMVTLTAFELGFALKSWGGDLSGTENPISILMDNDKVVKASFAHTATFTLTTNSTNGKIVLNPPGGVYNSGSKVVLTPQKDFGYKFSKWSGDISSSNASDTIIISSNKQVTAHFVSIPTYKIETNATHGIIELNPSGGIYEVGTPVEITARNDYGFKFNAWDGDISGTSNSTTIVVDSEKNITANFSFIGGDKIIFATNCGGNDYRSNEGILFKEDYLYSSGSTYSTTKSISGTEDDVLYQSNRYSNKLNYKIPLPNKEYNVIMMFAEIYHTEAKKRLFDVEIEGVKVSTSIDIFAKVGKNAAYTETHKVKVNDGELNIVLTSTEDNANISAIKVVEVENSSCH